MTLASRSLLSTAFQAVLTHPQRSLAAARIQAGERVICGADHDFLRVHDACAVEILASGGSTTDFEHDDEALLLVESLVRHCGSRPFQDAYRDRLVYSHYFQAIADSTEGEILEALTTS